MIKIYVLDLLYKELNGEEFLENQIHFSNKKEAIKYAKEWLKITQHTANKKYVKSIIASICWNEIDRKDIDFKELKICGFIETAQFTHDTIFFEKEILF